MPRKHRRRSWGSITEAQRGRKYILRWVENTPTGRRRLSRTVHGTYREACMELDRLHVEHERDAPVPTIGDVYQNWYAPWLDARLAQGRIKAGTHRVYTSGWTNFIGPRWSRVPIDSVRPIEVQEWLYSLNKSNAETSLIVLRRAMDFPVQYELAQSNKFRLDYELPSTRMRKKAGGTYDEAAAIGALETVGGTCIEAPFLLSCFGGARTGESIAVRPSEAVAETIGGKTFAAVRIVRRMPATGDAPLADGDLKNKQSVRVTVLPPPYSEAYLDIAERRAGEGSEWMGDRGDGLPLDRNRLNYVWRRVAGDLYIPFSNLRISWRTMAQFEWGIEPDLLELLMGHALPGVSGKHYIKPGERELIERFARDYLRST